MEALRRNSPLRILHGPCNIGNQPWVLSRKERKLGARSDLVINYNTWLQYSADRCLSALSDRSWRAVARRAAFAVSAPFRYDVLHYYFGRSFSCWDDYGPRNGLWFQDLRLAKRLGRKVFMTLQGCDARLSARSAAQNAITPCHEGHCQAVPVCRASLDSHRSFLIERILPLADRVFVLNPELAHFVPGAVFLPYSSVDLDRFSPTWPRTEGPIRIVHAPSDPHLKGTKYIIDAVERLKERHEIDFGLIQGLPHEKALEMYRNADIVIDQVLFGWYGGLAVEVMAMGKPVACYIREEDLQFVPRAMTEELPVLRVRPDTLEADMERIIAERALWPDWGRQARRFVEKWHNPDRIARAMIAAYESPNSLFLLPDER